MKTSLEMQSPSAKSGFKAPNSFIALEPKKSAPATREPHRVTLLMSDEDEAIRKGVRVMAVMLTRRCNMACAHCSVESGPRVQGQPTDEELLQLVRDAAKMGVEVIQLTGGEPMLREDLVIRMLAEIRALGLAGTLTTNGFWGKNPEVARQKTKALSDAGVTRMTVSYDRYHAEFQGPEPAVNIARAIEENVLPMLLSINYTREAGDDLADLVAPFDGMTKPQMRFYDVQAVGRARNIPRDDLRKECSGFCTACCVPAVTDDGRMMACNGPSYFSSSDSPLFVGSLKDHSLEDLAEKHRTDPILETIRTFGPARLRHEIEQMPELNVELRDGYSGMCDLCLHLTSQPEAMKALSARLSQPRFVAERFAAQRVMKAEQTCGGELERDYINTIGACRLFLRAMLEPSSSWAHEAERIWGRADFDWNQHAVHLMRCGLSIPLQNALKERALSRWAPPFFTEKLRRQSLTDSLRASLQREALRHIAQACREVETRGVLLKGTAMMALDYEADSAHIEYSNDAKRVGTRACCDVDVLISPDKSMMVREKLLQMGFERAGEDDGDVTLLRELPPMTYHGVLIEIHQRIMDATFGLPETEMLQRARPLQSAQWRGLFVLDAEGMLLHSVVHLSGHLFAHGLKTAWDVLWLLERFPQIEWNRIDNWVRKTGINRGFWVPFHVLCEELSLPVPSEFLQKAPRDTRQQKMEKVARRHAFGKIRFAYEDDVWVRQGFFLLMSDSWLHRASLVTNWLGGRYSSRRRQARRAKIASTLQGRAQLFSAIKKWRQLG